MVALVEASAVLQEPLNELEVAVASSEDEARAPVLVAGLKGAASNKGVKMGRTGKDKPASRFVASERENGPYLA